LEAKAEAKAEAKFLESAQFCWRTALEIGIKRLFSPEQIGTSREGDF